MKIIELELNHYHGFRLRQIKHFVYRPTAKTQVILGTNGSGKSRLLQELSPLPGSSSDYNKGGSKIITIDHENQHFVLKSLFEATGDKYIFEVDGENQNPGFGVKMYLELVKKYFNYSPEVHALMTGFLKFHNMRVNERRNWFTKISDNDFTYAIKYHQKLKDRVRGLQEAIKLSQSRLAHETEKCLTEEKAVELKAKVADLTQILNTLLEHRKPKLTDPGSYRAEIDNIEISLQSDLTALGKLLNEVEGNGQPVSIDALQDRSIALQASLGTLQNEITERCSRIEKYQSDISVINATSSSSLEDVKKSIVDLDEEESELISRLKYQVYFNQPYAALTSFESCHGHLSAILEGLSDLPRRDYHPTELGNYRDDLLVQQGLLNNANKHLKDLLDKKAHLQAHRDKDAVECPSCSHRWTLNYSDQEWDKNERQVALYTSAVAELEAKMAKINEEISRREAFFTLCRQYASLTSSATILMPLWKYIETTGYLETDPGKITMMLNSFASDLKTQVHLEQTRIRLVDQRKLAELMENTKLLNCKELEADVEKETHYLNIAQSKSRQAYTELEQTKASIQRLKMVDEYARASFDAIRIRDESLRLLVIDDCVSTLDEIIRSVRMTLSQYERTLSQVDLQKGIVKNLAAQIEETEKDLKLVKLAQKALSPTEGLIARGMTGFINQFVEQVNSFIANIWLYPLELVPVSADDDDTLDLDYKFMVKANDDEFNISPDIAKTSAGMQEVIDLAFVAVSMKYLGLHHWPIYLDEFARAFDPAHRQSAYQAIDHLIESTDYTQVYLVSHYQEGYSSLTASEVLVLCDSNVQLPDHLAHNTHVTMI